MTGYQAYRYYLALKLHFSTDSFDVFKNPHVKYSADKFEGRRDKMLFERLAKKYPTDRDIVRYYVSNFAYGNNDAIWKDDTESELNLVEWKKRKESITKYFSDDIERLSTMIYKKKMKKNEILYFDYGSEPVILSQYLGQHIKVETIVILDDFFNFISEWNNCPLKSLWYDDEIRKITKLKKFVRYDANRIKPIIQSFSEDLDEF